MVEICTRTEVETKAMTISTASRIKKQEKHFGNTFQTPVNDPG
jgi:hypothetical protein